MKTPLRLAFRPSRVALALAMLSTLYYQPFARAQGTAFTYQGRLSDNGNPANGNYNLRLTLYDANVSGSVVGGPLTNAPVTVSNGLFAVLLDFGPGVFTGPARWLQIDVSSNSVAPAYVSLTTRQQLTPAPYAIYSENSGAANSVSANSVTTGSLNTAGAPASGQVLSYNGSTLLWANPPSIGWSLTGNAGTTPGTDFLGTSDYQPLELWVNGGRAFRLEPGAGGSPNVVGGSSSSADSSVNGGTIAGGIGNTVSNIYPTVSGGEYNKATANGAVVGGGYNNSASGRFSTISGGVQGNATGIGAFIGGGGYDGTTQAGNSAGGAAATVPGGLDNNATGPYATISGGAYNQASSSYDTVPGGSYNVASGGDSFAAGHQAQALHLGSFVWADATGGAFQSTGIDQFDVRALGGVRFVTGGAGLSGMTLDGYQVLTTATGGGGGVITNSWLLTGNSGANPANGYFLGTIDTNALELRVNGQRGLRLEPGAALNQPNVIGGSSLNTVVGGSGATIGGGLWNTNNANYATIGGGAGNSAGYGATVPGGMYNRATGNGSFAAGRSAQTTYDGSFVWGDGTQTASSTGPNRFEVLATGGITFYPGASNVSVSGNLNVTANASVCTLTIRGGCDVAEPFEMSTLAIVKGSVVVIDDEHAGQLKLSDRAYDTRVAGIVSGANGINPGIALHQEGALQEGQNVALSGRVYVLADASGRPIAPGDLLTTSEIPGHAMKATDHAKAQGAILGKAMTGLKDGKGMVLVLVTLQ